MSVELRAALLGVSCGSRTFAGPGALALRGRPESSAARRAILALAAAEALADKLPFAGPRSRPAPLAARGVSAAACGAAIGGRRGALIGGAFALALTLPSERARASIVERTGLPDPACALLEDSLVYGAAWLASGPA